MSWASIFALALEAFMARSETIKLGNGGSLTASDVSGNPVHFGIGQAFTALEEFEAGKFDGENATIQIGSIQVVYTPPTPAVAVEPEPAQTAPADAEKATAPVEAAATVTEAAAAPEPAAAAS